MHGELLNHRSEVSSVEAEVSAMIAAKCKQVIIIPRQQSDNRGLEACKNSVIVKFGKC